ncbi:hypothetical protein ABPG74_020593 [Tetrahymena malaccensis]
MGNQCTGKKKYQFSNAINSTDCFFKFRQKKKLYRLDDRLGFQDINDEAMIQISEQILKECLNSQKLKLELSINKIGNPGLISLGEAISQCINLKELNLDLGANKYDQNGAKQFCNYLSKCRELTSLTLSFDQYQHAEFPLQDEDFKNIQESLQQLEHLTYLNLKLSYNVIKDGAKHLGQLISKLNKLESFAFDLRQSQLTNQGLIGIVDGIIANPSKFIKINLQLEYNSIHQESAIRLGQAIPMCQNLVELRLYLKANRVGVNGTQQIGIGIGQCPNLKMFHLEFMYSHFGEEGFILLARGFSRSKSLVQFSLDNWQMISKQNFDYLQDNIQQENN